ncbi:PREDICTED: uncharacterized protein LOC109175506 [Ipomoea nil]|uniref:uncharacterized protein LOC109175506 n=1 Tax=Ipomoea nil TaxID=35883 RepID=UPI0009016C4C|nr:PREDICTED: uncharacterized protein LOC109175506 [Ipomoea nil]
MANSGKSIQEKTLTGVGNLIRLLPTGTVFIFQFLNPVLTNNGQCAAVNKWLSAALIAICGFSCGFSSFTDSYTDDQGQTHYAVATAKGLWPSPGDGGDWSAFRIRLGDFVHAAFTMLVFGALVLLDRNTVDCYYPAFESTQKVLLMVLPPVIGAVSGSVFMIFPNRRHGIGYPQEQVDDKTK